MFPCGPKGIDLRRTRKLCDRVGSADDFRSLLFRWIDPESSSTRNLSRLAAYGSSGSTSSGMSPNVVSLVDRTTSPTRTRTAAERPIDSCPKGRTQRIRNDIAHESMNPIVGTDGRKPSSPRASGEGGFDGGTTARRARRTSIETTLENTNHKEANSSNGTARPAGGRSTRRIGGRPPATRQSNSFSWVPGFRARTR
jgi:hypothetical protein